MMPDRLKKSLLFYFITDETAKISPVQQVMTAIRGGATMVQYRNKSFTTKAFSEVQQIQTICRANGVPFIINDNILLARAVKADGVHLGQDDEAVSLAREVLGKAALVGISVSTVEELARTDLDGCDYIGTGPVFGTISKPDAKPTIGLEGISAVAKATALPVVAIGGVDSSTAADCLTAGAQGVAVISCISRSANPLESARDLARVCGIKDFPDQIETPWTDEFDLIGQCLTYAPPDTGEPTTLLVPPGDDAAVLRSIQQPVISTDAHVEDVHFSFNWQTAREVGYKAVVVTLSDLAAAYALPAALFVNLSLPRNVSMSLSEELYGGIKDALEEYGCLLGGGNISAGENVSLNMFVVGEARASYPPRSAARAGDYLCCTGYLGLARAGLLILQQNEHAPSELIDRFKFPRARFDAAKVLADRGVTCVIDVSDGLVGDVGHIAKASQVTIAFDWQADFVSPALSAWCKQRQKSPEEMIYKGGEDYELLFTCSADKLETIQRHLPGVYPIGRCLPYTGRCFQDDSLENMSFQHGAVGETGGGI